MCKHILLLFIFVCQIYMGVQEKKERENLKEEEEEEEGFCCRTAAGQRKWRSDEWVG